MKGWGAQLGSVGAALLASACCLGPLVLGAIGLGSAGVGAMLEPWRPWFLGVTALLLGVAFRFAYRPLREAECGPDGVCIAPASRTKQRITLWIVALVTVACATYPDWRGRLFQAEPTAASPLSGQWRGVLKVGEGRTTDLVVDLGMVGPRWAGQFDLHEFGVENYPVDVSLEGNNVTLRLSAAKIDFAGTLNGEELSGMATTEGGRDSLVLRRVGEAEFSTDFLDLETADADPARLEPLSADGAALRDRFNADRDHTRLVMLLSPS